MSRRNSTNIIRLGVGVALAVSFLFPIGCAWISPARISRPLALAGQVRLARSVAVTDIAVGGKSCLRCGLTAIGNKDFRRALVGALENSMLFDSVIQRDGDLNVSASILYQRNNPSGRTLEVATEILVAYQVRDRHGDVVWSGAFRSTGSSAKLSGMARMVQATEVAVRENLRAFLSRIQIRLAPRDSM